MTATAAAEDSSSSPGSARTGSWTYTADRFEEHVHDADGVLDAAGGETQARSWVALRPSGTLVSDVQTPEADKAAAHGPAACSSSSNRTAPDWRRSRL
ncbi:hypothetical protein [Streptomyces sp. NPDC091209]|uniref:hypothetical protein n=1 Tax=Streptomyces sp. NPDC091209 TaxID=3365974 RepID=UPI00382E5034